MLSPVRRTLAIFAIVGFTAAQTLCFIHCHFSALTAQAKPSCHRAPSNQSECEGKSSSPALPSSSLTCSTLKNLLVDSTVVTTPTPELNFLFLLPDFASVQEVTPDDLELLIFRQVNFLSWVFEPEVSLGPAFFSLPPPFIG